MAPPIKKFKSDETEKDDDATGDHTHSNLDLRMEVDVNDVVNLLRFPADTSPTVWLNVFSKLDPADKPAFFRAMPEWHDWVSLQRTTFLAPEVAPMLLETLPMKSLLSSRLICKAWTNGLNTHIQNHPMHLHLPFEIDYKKKHPVLEYVHKFTSTERIRRFLDEMEFHPRNNPLFSRNIELGLVAPGGEQELNLLLTEYWNNAILLLNLFGGDVLYAKIDFTFSADHNGLELGRIFRELIVNLPNLKRLSLRGFILTNSYEIKTYFGQNPLPLLRNLEMVDNDCISDNLEVLDTHLDIWDLEILANPEGAPPLKEVNLQFLETPSISELFTKLLPFRDTLVNVATPHVRVLELLDKEEGCKIDLPNLRRLSIEFYQGDVDPLMQLSGSLTHLTINRASSYENNTTVHSLDGSVKRTPKDSVDFYGFEEDMYRSNIWELCPSLISIKLGYNHHDFKRSEYEARNSKFDRKI
ncbi:hypothetical protein Ocin01_17510 [Orchesella cincta]|uniref:F-box domain-containing protein n=1 Tax=Orchesella cincta TaxID=48709 RepID=A0A1D2M8B9_ORCCI|nr:hypothetical protein Ocin01_17510 [Orchesella cincta]